MRKIAILLIAALLMATLPSGCSGGDEPQPSAEPTVDWQPQTTITTEFADLPSEEVLPEAMDIPLEATEEPAETLDESVETPMETAVVESTPAAPVSSGYTLTALKDDTFGFVCAYPDGWKNLPGKYTLCFREEVEPDDFPARMAVTSKRMAHTPKPSTVLEQFQTFAKEIYAVYDPATFEFGELNSAASFLGQTAYEITYLAYSGEIEVKGYMICCNVGRVIYIYHFCASYEDYAVMEPMMKQIRDTITLTD